jgi:hypothetical protein
MGQPLKYFDDIEDQNKKRRDLAPKSSDALP